MIFLAIDPGREKFGYAVFKDGKVEEKGVLPLRELGFLIQKCCEAEKVVIGKGTGWKVFYKFLKERGIEEKRIVLVGEKGSTEEAKRRYFKEVRRPGLIWFLRKLLNLPDRPLDDISAQIIGEKFLKNC